MIDFACRHSKGDGFDCGNEHLNAGLAARLAEPPDPADITVLVFHEGDDVVRAYAVVLDVLLRLERPDQDERCFWIAALAVDSRHQGGATGAAMMSRILALLRSRSTSRAYAAIVVTNFFDYRLERRYLRRGYRRVAGENYLWFRRLGGGDLPAP